MLLFTRFWWIHTVELAPKKKSKKIAGRAKEWQEKHTANEAPEAEGTSLPTSLQARGVDIS